jgi:hypothetical protein
MKRALAALATAALVSGGIGAAALGLAATAYADSPGPYYWCPGDDMAYHAPRGERNGPGVAYGWDMNICHTWYWVRDEAGNVPYKGKLPSGVWDGDNPPALQPDWCNFCW